MGATDGLGTLMREVGHLVRTAGLAARAQSAGLWPRLSEEALREDVELDVDVALKAGDEPQAPATADDEPRDEEQRPLKGWRLHQIEALLHQSPEGSLVSVVLHELAFRRPSRMVEELRQAFIGHLDAEGGRLADPPLPDPSVPGDGTEGPRSEPTEEACPVCLKVPPDGLVEWHGGHLCQACKDELRGL